MNIKNADLHNSSIARMMRACQGRNDLIARNSARRGMFRRAVFFYRRWGLSTRDAWALAHAEYRELRDER